MADFGEKIDPLRPVRGGIGSGNPILQPGVEGVRIDLWIPMSTFWKAD